MLFRSHSSILMLIIHRLLFVISCPWELYFSFLSFSGFKTRNHKKKFKTLTFIIFLYSTLSPSIFSTSRPFLSAIFTYQRWPKPLCNDAINQTLTSTTCEDPFLDQRAAPNNPKTQLLSFIFLLSNNRESPPKANSTSMQDHHRSDISLGDL